ncbi:MAG TPA: LPS export ABC transporter ATP-binding protein [Bacteroidetes bacterium]|nr:LPS export ABC transporter ATP-binding protein [Bacteroidota bacterium]|tara:strand:+ start:347 stop:1072 length:726 start_codon:yes stop_codon:yes gene_type:complete
MIESQGLIKRYGRRIVVDKVGFSVNQGEVVGLLGPNGAGKTTTFNMIVGLVKPDQGLVGLNKIDITTKPMYKRARMGITYLPQEASVYRHLSVEDNLMAVIEFHVKSKKARREKCEELISEFDLGNVRKTKGGLLSGGERRRTEIARALASGPSYVLLDEPFAGIDPIAVEAIQRIVVKLKSLGLGVLITDHNVQETLNIVDRAYLMHEGKVFAEGNPQQLAENPLAKKIYLGDRFKLRNS